MTETVTWLRPHLRHERFAVVQCDNRWELRLFIDNVTVKQEAIPRLFAEALINGVRGADA